MGKIDVVGNVSEVAASVNEALAREAGTLGPLPRNVITRVVPVAQAEKGMLSVAVSEMLAEGRAAGLTRFSEVEVLQRPLGNKKGGAPCYLLRVYAQ